MSWPFSAQTENILCNVSINFHAFPRCTKNHQSFALFCGTWCLVVGIASYLNSKNSSKLNQNLFIRIFSYQSHWTQLCSTERGENLITCLDGIRALSLFWIILGHLHLTFEMRTNPERVINQMKNGDKSFAIFTYGASLAVDTFFFIGGLLLAYVSTQKIITYFNSLKRIMCH